MGRGPLSSRRWLWIGLSLALVFILYLLLSAHYQDEEKQVRTQFRQKVKESFPEQTEEFSRTIGLFQYGGIDQGAAPGQPGIVLIHGLDDPGKVWQNLAPTLASAGYNVWLMHYPNDQPITESTRLFLSELHQLRKKDIRSIVVIAHSMGGLVTRDLLTDPEIGYAGLVSEQLVPMIERFIMVGTPNHGSQLARFRFFAEFRDHFERFRKGEASWLGSILDGAGEAKIDLLPGSSFLQTLNSRPYPQELDSLIIAGITSPWTEQDIAQQMDALADSVPDQYNEDIARLGDYLVSMTHGLGDGLVTVESSRLEGVPHVTVPGTHLTMIRNISPTSDRVPPAVPVILGWLATGP